MSGAARRTPAVPRTLATNAVLALFSVVAAACTPSDANAPAAPAPAAPFELVEANIADIKPRCSHAS